MKEPMLWNTLEDAANWLSGQTETAWDSRKIISFSIEHYCDKNKIKRNEPLYTIKDGGRKLRISKFDKNKLVVTHLPPSPTYLSILFPRGVNVGIYHYEKDIEKFNQEYQIIPGGLIRVFETGLKTAPLYLKNLSDIYLYDDTEINLPYVCFMDQLGRWEYGLFEPLKELTENETNSLNSLARAHHGYLMYEDIASIGGKYRITSDMLGIHKKSLQKLLSDYLHIKKLTNELKQKKESPILTENLRKALTCIAIDKYGYDPDAKQSSVPKQLSDMFSEHGLDITDRTIRDWLKEGKQLLFLK